jgi:predicted nucleic acid binding AN1-type Zn finger protein
VSMATVTVTENSKVKNKEKELQEATASKDLDVVLNKVKKLDNTCSFMKCKKRTNDFAIECKFCNGRYCPTHGLPEIHGCGEAVRKEEKRKYLHPNVKLSNEKHSQAQTKLNLKLKQMQQERKSKQGFSNKGKK